MAVATHVADRVQNASKNEGKRGYPRALLLTAHSSKRSVLLRKSVMTPVCPSGDPGLITRRSRVQIPLPATGLRRNGLFLLSLDRWQLGGKVQGGGQRPDRAVLGFARCQGDGAVQPGSLSRSGASAPPPTRESSPAWPAASCRFSFPSWSSNGAMSGASPTARATFLTRPSARRMSASRVAVGTAAPRREASRRYSFSNSSMKPSMM